MVYGEENCLLQRTASRKLEAVTDSWLYTMPIPIVKREWLSSFGVTRGHVLRFGVRSGQPVCITVCLCSVSQMWRSISADSSTCCCGCGVEKMTAASFVCAAAGPAPTMQTSSRLLQLSWLPMESR